MIKEDKELLLADLCARLPYNVHLFTNSKHNIKLLTISNDIDYDEQYWINGLYDIDEVKPYLRPMSSMTKEEVNSFMEILSNVSKEVQNDTLLSTYKVFDFCNAKHIDYRGLISKNLAIEVTKENNPYKN